jgi:hypothetical protein
MATVEVTVSGLVGDGLVLQNKGGDDLAIDGDGTFAFAESVPYGTAFDVTVLIQPTSPSQICVVTDGTGTVDERLVHVTVDCTIGKYKVGGVVSGFKGVGLELQNNGGDDLVITENGSFSFAMPLDSGEEFAVTVKSQPTGPSQTCVVTSGTGSVTSSHVTTVMVDCTVDTFTIGGTVSGLTGTVVLQNNLGDNLPLTANGAFTFATPIDSGATYSVTVLTQPTSPHQTCAVTNASGQVWNGDVTNVRVVCSVNAYLIGGTVSGLAGTNLVLQNNGGDDLTLNANGMFAFATPVLSGGTFAVTIKDQPTNPWQTCTVAGGTGSVVGANVSTVMIDCTTNLYTVGGNVTGLDGTGLQLSFNGGTPLPINANGTYAFPTSFPSGTSYTVTVVAQPTDNWQTCTVNNHMGTVGGTDVTNVDVSCVTNTYTISGTVTGLAGGGLVLQNNGSDDLAVPTAGPIAFTTKVASGQPYSVSVLVQPSSPWQTCVVTNAAGTVAGADITDVTVTCTTNMYSVGGTISGLTGTVVLRNNGGDDLTLMSNGPFTFQTELASNSTYLVTVVTPGTPAQTCTVAPGTGSGTVTNADVTSVVVICNGTRTYNFTGAIESFTVPGGVTSIRIDASGAQGGTATYSSAPPGGLGAFASGTFTVTPSQSLRVIVGGAGVVPTGGCGYLNGGGGGGSFVWDPLSTTAPLIVAGGGGGSGSCATGTAGPGLALPPGSGNGGTCGPFNNGNGTGGGGAGWLTNGVGASITSCGQGAAALTPLNGGTGGAPTMNTCYQNGAGGFGGGGGGGGNCGGGGGGGGYSGGNGGSNVLVGGSQSTGGTSFNAGTNQTNTAGVRAGNGVVTISW